MFCPKCRAEYVRGITRCADCGMELVDELPEPPELWEEEEHDEGESTCKEGFQELLTTYYGDEIAFLKSVLNDANITYYFANEDAMTPPGTGPARLMVRKDQAEEARNLLKDMQFRSDYPQSDT